MRKTLICMALVGVLLLTGCGGSSSESKQITVGGNVVTLTPAQVREAEAKADNCSTLPPGEQAGCEAGAALLGIESH